MSIYKIVTVGDFLKVPEERIDACLAEFKEFIALARAVTELAKVAGEVVGAAGSECITERFTWIDDGKRDVTINIGCARRNPPPRPPDKMRGR